MSFLAATLLAITLGLAILIYGTHRRIAARAEYIRSYTLPPGLYDKLRQKRPGLTLKECQLTGHALRQFFLAYLKSGRKFVSMPSQIADDLWHEFILYTRHYDAFCRQAFGRFMHHTPAAALSSDKRSNAGLRRVWWYACKEENINPRAATRLPLLFAIDAKLAIPDGFRYAANCSALRGNADSRNGGTGVYCGGDFSDTSFDGGTEGFGDSASDSGSDGCGGGGCGGD